jgi:predicted transcriptional regulator
LTQGNSEGSEYDEAQLPVVGSAQIRRSITRDALISFLDGKPYKTLKRHVGKHGLTPEGYRARFGLPSDYPMVASSYSERRSAIANSIGLGAASGRGFKAARG